MVETITENVFSQLLGALSALENLAQELESAQEYNERLTRFSKFDPSQSAFITAFDQCGGDITKLRQLQDDRRIGIIELEIRAFNESELERQVERQAYTVKQLTRQALDYYHNRKPRDFDTPLAGDVAIAIRAVQTIQAINKRASQKRLIRSQWSSLRNSEECQAVVKNTLAMLHSTVKALSGVKRGYLPGDSVFDSSAYPCDTTSGDSDFRFSRNWRHHYQDLLSMKVLPANLDLTAPACFKLHHACRIINESEGHFADALEELLTRMRGTDLKPNRLTLALQAAHSDEDLAAVARDRHKLSHENRYEYVAFEALLKAALQLRDARAEASALMLSAVQEAEELGARPRHDVRDSDNHFVAAVYQLYSADLILRRSGQNLASVKQNKAFMERYQVMQGDLHRLIAEITEFARERMF